MNTNDFTRAMQLEEDIRDAIDRALVMSGIKDGNIRNPRVYSDIEKMLGLKGIVSTVSSITDTSKMSDTELINAVFAASLVVKLKESKFEELHSKEILKNISSVSFIPSLDNDAMKLAHAFWDKIGAGCIVLSQHEEPSINISSTEEDDEKTLSMLKELQFMRQNSINMPQLTGMLFAKLKDQFPNINIDGDFSGYIADLEARVNAKKGKSESTTLYLPEEVIVEETATEPVAATTAEVSTNETEAKTTEEQPEKTGAQQFEELKANLTADGWTLTPFSDNYAEKYGAGVSAYKATKEKKNDLMFFVDLNGEMFTEAPKLILFSIGGDGNFRFGYAIKINDLKSLIRVANNRKPKYLIDPADYGSEFIFDLYKGSTNLKNFKFIKAWARHFRKDHAKLYDKMIYAGYNTKLPTLYTVRVDNDTVQFITTLDNKLWCTVRLKNGKYSFEYPKSTKEAA